MINKAFFEKVRDEFISISPDSITMPGYLCHGSTTFKQAWKIFMFRDTIKDLAKEYLKAQKISDISVDSVETLFQRRTGYYGSPRKIRLDFLDFCIKTLI